MPRPKAKPELIEAANEQFEIMWNLIQNMTDDEKHATFHFGEHPRRKEAHWNRDQNIRDVLVHLYEWHQLLLKWVDANQRGEARLFLPAPYSWKTYGQMNIEFWEKHQKTSLADAIEMLQGSHKKVMKIK